MESNDSSSEFAFLEVGEGFEAVDLVERHDMEFRMSLVWWEIESERSGV